MHCSLVGVVPCFFFVFLFFVVVLMFVSILLGFHQEYIAGETGMFIQTQPTAGKGGP